MAENQVQFSDLTGREYRVPEEMAKATPVHYANSVQINLTNEGVGLLFGVRLDTLGQGIESSAIVPQVACFISIQQALGLAQALGAGIPALIQEMQKQAQAQAAPEVVSAV